MSTTTTTTAAAATTTSTTQATAAQHRGGEAQRTTGDGGERAVAIISVVAAASGCAPAFVAASRALAIATSATRWSSPTTTSTTTPVANICGLTEAAVAAGLARSVLGRQAMTAVAQCCCCCCDVFNGVRGCTGHQLCAIARLMEIAEPLRRWVEEAAAMSAAAIGISAEAAVEAARWCVTIHVLNRAWCTHRVQCTACSLAMPEQLLDAVATFATAAAAAGSTSTSTSTSTTSSSSSSTSSLMSLDECEPSRDVTAVVLSNDTVEAISWHTVLQQISQQLRQQQQQVSHSTSTSTSISCDTGFGQRSCSVRGDPPVMAVLRRARSETALSGDEFDTEAVDDMRSESLFSNSGFVDDGEDAADSAAAAEAASVAARTASSFEDDTTGDDMAMTMMGMIGTSSPFATPASPIRRRQQPWPTIPTPTRALRVGGASVESTPMATDGFQQQPQFPAPPREWVQAVVDQALAQAQSAIFAGIRAKQGELVGAVAQTGADGESRFMPVPWNWCPWLPKESLYRVKPCSYFFHTGHCSKGDACNFSHEVRPDMIPPPPPPALKRAPGMSPTGYVPVEMLLKTKPCKFFFARGWCLKGEHCNFSHDLH